MTPVKSVIAQSIFYFVLLTFYKPCKGGFFSNLGGFVLNRISRLKFLDDQKSSRTSTGMEIKNPPSAQEIIMNLTNGNEILRTQVKSLKSIVNVQKRQISDVKKEKDALRQLMTSQLSDAAAAIKAELRDSFEEEKVVMIASFEEEKVLLKEDHVEELRDIKLEMSQQLNKKEAELEAKKFAELEVVTSSNIKQSEIIEEYKKSSEESSKDIAELKQALRAKDIAMKELRSSSTNPKSEIIPVSAAKKLDNDDRPLRRSKPAKSSGSSSKSSASSSNRPPIEINSPNPSGSARGGL